MELAIIWRRKNLAFGEFILRMATDQRDSMIILSIRPIPLNN